MVLNRLVNTGRFNIFTFGSLVSSEEAVELCYETGLIPRVALCPNGHGVMSRNWLRLLLRCGRVEVHSGCDCGALQLLSGCVASCYS